MVSVQVQLLRVLWKNNLWIYCSFHQLILGFTYHVRTPFKIVSTLELGTHFYLVAYLQKTGSTHVRLTRSRAPQVGTTWTCSCSHLRAWLPAETLRSHKVDSNSWYQKDLPPCWGMFWICHMDPHQRELQDLVHLLGEVWRKHVASRPRNLGSTSQLRWALDLPCGMAHANAQHL
jgi:hypothetical protein